MRRIVPLVLSLAVAAALAVNLSGAVKAADDEKIPMTITAGDSLSPTEHEAVRKVLLAYLDAVKIRDWKTAAKYVDRESFLAAVEPLIENVAPDPAKREEARRMIFGVGTTDSLVKKPLPDLFWSMMTYAMTADPTGAAMMEKAKFSLLGARKIKGKVHIAYMITVAAESDTLQPYTRVTAERLRKVGNDWKIMIAQDHGGGRAKP